MMRYGEDYIFRPARPEDKGAVLAFTRHTWEWGDYIPLVWDRWIRHRRGELTVATYRGTPVLISKTTMLSPIEAWFEGLRVAPEHRGKGLGQADVDYQIRVARAQGATVARLAVFSQNQPPQRLMAKLGWPCVATITPYARPVPANPRPLARVLTIADAAAAWAFVTSAPGYHAGHHLYARGWAWHELTYPKLRRHVAAGTVTAVCTPRGGIQALAIAMLRDGRDTLHVEYADGWGRHLVRLARDLLYRAAGKGACKVLAMLTDEPGILAAFAQAGYVNDMNGEGSLLIYEKDIADQGG